MEKLYSVQQSREIDQQAITEHGISGALLMQRAGFTLFKNIPSEMQKITIFIGAGNNGGDGLVAAFFSIQANKNVKVVHLTDLDALKGDAKIMLEHAKKLGVKFIVYENNYQIPDDNEVIIDALLGTGINKHVSGKFQSAIQKINCSGSYIISADIPSGICGNTGRKYGDAVKANKTCTFVCYKKGLFTSDASDHLGELIYNDLGVPEVIYQNIKNNVFKLNFTKIEAELKVRQQNSHKGSFGNLVVVAGDKGMAGAALMNSISALKMGAGKVHLITHPDHSHSVCINFPEIMVHGLSHTDEILKLCVDASAILVGSGMSIGLNWSDHLFSIIAKLEKPIIADAGILDYISESALMSQDVIITPHPGEAARMLKIKGDIINNDRFQAVYNLSKNYQCTAVLKGKGTLIHSARISDQIFLCPYGNPAMATAGMGDVLAGMMAGLRVQGYNSFQAAKIAVTLHSHKADDLVFNQGKKRLIASDIYHNL